MNLPEPNTITFSNDQSSWVVRITADRKIEVNPDVTMDEAAQTFINAVQHLLTPQITAVNDEDLPILGILQKAHSVPLGCPIWETDEEYEKLKKIVITAIRVTEERYGVK